MAKFANIATIATILTAVARAFPDENARSLLARRLPAEAAPTGYMLEDNKYYKTTKSNVLKFSSGYKAEQGYGGQLKISECASYCDSTKDCIGFNFRYDESTSTAEKEIYKCTGYKEDAQGKMEDYAGGQVGSAYYKRNAVSGGSSKFIGFQGDAKAAPVGYTVEDNVGCDGGDKKDQLNIGKRKALTVDECKAFCESWAGCIAFNQAYNLKAPYESLKDYCTMWKTCTIRSTGKSGSAWYARDAGASPGTAVAPGTATTGAAGGTGSTSAAAKGNGTNKEAEAGTAAVCQSAGGAFVLMAIASGMLHL